MCSLRCCLLFPVYVLLSLYINCKGVWRWANEWDIQCEHPPLAGNQSGLKVVLAGWAKCGTWTLSHALGQLGYNAYHSQEFNYHVWSPIADEYWMRPENGGRRSKIVTIPTLPFAMQPNATDPSALPFPSEDWEVLKNMKTETLARGLSKCRVDAVALDGIQNLHEAVIDASPGVKVLMLDWRTFEKWDASMVFQGKSMVPIQLFFDVVFYSSLHFLPWGLLVKAIDPLINNDIEKLLKTGGPPFIQKCPVGVMLWHPFAKNRQIYSHWMMGLGFTKQQRDEKEYYALFEKVRKKVPESNILSWDFKTKGWEDLCTFLNVKDCPKKGKLKTEPNGYTDLFRNGGRGWEFNCDEPFILAPLYICLHWVNFKLFITILTLPGLLLRSGSREKND